ncbi:hypothetical protein Tco_0644878 [Tanacetum coccineum]
MSAVVAQGHDGGDDPSRPPPCPIGTGCRGVGGRKASEGGRGGGRDGRSKGIRKETMNLGLKKITDEYGPLKIRFEWNDKGTMLHLGENSVRWRNLVGEIQHFDLIPHIRSKLWPDIKKGIDQHMAKVYVYNKSALKAKRWTVVPGQTRDVAAIRSRPPANVLHAQWDTQIDYWLDPKHAA